MLKMHETAEGEYAEMHGDEIWRFDWRSGGKPMDSDQPWHQHPVLGPLYKKIGMTLYNDPEWLTHQMSGLLGDKQRTTNQYADNNYRIMDDMLDSKVKPMPPDLVKRAKMSDAEYIKTEILPDFNRLYKEITLEDLPKETITAVLSQYSTAIPAGPPPKQAEFNFDNEETILKRKIEETEKALADPELMQGVRYRDTEAVRKQAMLENQLEQLKIEYNQKFGKGEYEAPDTSTMDSEGGGQAQHFENFRMNDVQLIWEAYEELQGKSHK